MAKGLNMGEIINTDYERQNMREEYYQYLREKAIAKANPEKKIQAKLVKKMIKMSSFGAITQETSVDRKLGTSETDWVQKQKEYEQALNNERLEQVIDPRTGSYITAEVSDLLKQTRDELREMWTRNAASNYLSEFDADVEVYDSNGNLFGESGAIRLPDGEHGVRIRFRR